MELNYTIIIPVYNRPQEIEDLLTSLLSQAYKKAYEVIIVEDGSTNKCDSIVNNFRDKLNVTYLFKENSGAGQSRNYGMNYAKGNYFIILDSDIILPKNYLIEIDKSLQINFTDAFGGADTTHKSFTALQKAINYTMTSFLTTGGLRNNRGSLNKFQLRSYNMGISKKVFEETQGFSKQKFGEDIDLTYRLWKKNFKTQFIKEAFVYHKRRTNFKYFFKQTLNFGSARPVLNKLHKNSNKITYWFPSLFIIGLIISLIFIIFHIFIYTYFYVTYFALLFFDSLLKNRNFRVAFLSIFTTIIQFLGYGLGFLKSQFRLQILNKSVKEIFPKMFY
ncbi:MAG: glycosyltransferase [Flavobacteriaceae bacterium]|nr:glycosyltransferase [Flavobacteriaceae bacterium]